MDITEEHFRAAVQEAYSAGWADARFWPNLRMPGPVTVEQQAEYVVLVRQFAGKPFGSVLL